MDLDAKSNSQIDSVVAAVAAGVAVGTGDKAGVGVALGIAAARNYIGWNPNGKSVTADYQSSESTAKLSTGEIVQVASGPLEGEFFEYVGSTQTDGVPDITGKSETQGDQQIDLSVQEYLDSELWRHASLGPDPAEVRARTKETAIHASKAFTADAVANQRIESVVFAGSAAVTAGKGTALAISAAGVYVENRIQSFVHANIEGDGANQSSDGINAASIALNANDTSVINATAAAASVAASFTPNKTGVSVAVGLSLAFNEVNNSVFCARDQHR